MVDADAALVGPAAAASSAAAVTLCRHPRASSAGILSGHPGGARCRPAGEQPAAKTCFFVEDGQICELGMINVFWDVPYASYENGSDAIAV